MKKSRREFLKNAGIAAIGTIALSNSKKVFANELFAEPVTFELPALSYAYDGLEPHIDAMTMQIHHDKHHKAYVDNLNKAVADNKITGMTIEKLLASVSTLPVAIRNNGGGHYNHSMFWKLMKPNGGGDPKGPLAEAIISTFGSMDVFKTKFNDAAKSRFGSGWAWLVAKDGKLDIGSTPNQDNPLMDLSELKGTPILCLDVWEHAYYLKYQNKRPDYISAWWNVINWEEAQNRFTKK